MCKIWWKVTDARIWCWDEIKWQKSAHSAINDEMRINFHILCDGPFLHGKTTAISKSPYHNWWKVVDARIWWWDWAAKNVHSVIINDSIHTIFFDILCDESIFASKNYCHMGHSIQFQPPKCITISESVETFQKVRGIWKSLLTAEKFCS